MKNELPLPTREEFEELLRLLREADLLMDRQNELLQTADRLRQSAERRAELLEGTLLMVLDLIDSGTATVVCQRRKDKQ